MSAPTTKLYFNSHECLCCGKRDGLLIADNILEGTKAVRPLWVYHCAVCREKCQVHGIKRARP